LANYSFEELEQILAFKPQCERTHIISDERRQAYESLKASYLASTTAFEKENDLDCLKTLAKSEILEQISNNNLKGFVSYKVLLENSYYYWKIEKYSLLTNKRSMLLLQG